MVSNWSDFWTILMQDQMPIQFLQPEWFALLLLWPLMWAWHRWRGQAADWEQMASKQSNTFRHSLIEQLGLARVQSKHHNGWRWFFQVLRLGLLVTLVLALAQPIMRVSMPPEPQTKTVRDIVFVVETGVSMVLEDYEIAGQSRSRIDVIKQVLDQFVSGLDGNRFGYILYADQAYTLMPLTSDGVTARLMLKRLRPYLAGRTDEATAEALGLALQQAERHTETTEKRIVVMISDGSTRQSRIPIAEAINYAQGLNVPIYTVGVGASTESADKRAFRGLIYETIEADSLKTIAQETGGQYHQIGSGNDLQKVLQAIDQTEGVAIEAPRKKYEDVALYHYFLAMTLMLFVMYVGLLQLLAARLQKEGA